MEENQGDKGQEKALVGRRIARQFALTKGSEIEKALVDDKGDDLWAFASVEVPDAALDVVRIEGIDWSDYHRPPQTYLKILAQHQTSSGSTGEPFVIGRVEEFLKTSAMVDGEKVPALAFKMSWAKDGDGTLTDLAKKYKGLFDAGYLDSFSVGMLVHDYEELDSGGLDFTQTQLFEISAVSIPANFHANVIRRDIQNNELADILRSVEGMTATQAEIAQGLLAQAEEITRLRTEVQQALESFGGMLSGVSKHFDGFDSRLDLIESSFVASSAPAPKTSDRNGGNSEKQALDAFNDIGERLRRAAKG